MYIGSADLMERNLERRVEVLCPILDPALTKYLRDVVLFACLQDTARASILGRDGRYTRVAADASGLDAQHFLMARHTTEYARD